MMSNVCKLFPLLLGLVILALIFLIYGLQEIHNISWLSSFSTRNGQETVIKEWKVRDSSEPNTVDGVKEKGAAGDPFWGAACRKMPDCLIIGFEKCGTVTLKQYLTLNKNIFVPKEPNEAFFNPGEDAPFALHTMNYSCTPTDKIRVEKMSIKGRPDKVFQYNKYMKLIAIVKDPVDRALSHFIHRVELGLEREGTFKEVIQAHLVKNTHLHSILFKQGIYIKLLHNWMRFFNKSKIHIVDGQHFIKRPSYELRRVERFLGLKPNMTKGHFVYNPEKNFFCIRESDGPTCMKASKGRPHPEMDNETRQILATYFAPYTAQFYKEFGVNYNWTVPDKI